PQARTAAPNSHVIASWCPSLDKRAPDWRCFPALPISPARPSLAGRESRCDSPLARSFGKSKLLSSFQDFVREPAVVAVEMVIARQLDDARRAAGELRTGAVVLFFAVDAQEWRSLNFLHFGLDLVA